MMKSAPASVEDTRYLGAPHRLRRVILALRCGADGASVSEVYCLKTAIYIHCWTMHVLFPLLSKVNVRAEAYSIKMVI